MGSSAATAEFVLAQLSPLGEVEAKRMFGEYGLYCQGVFFGLICDDRLYVKPTAAGREYLVSPLEGQPYPNAKPHFCVDDRVDNGPWLCELVRRTVSELGRVPKRKK